ncbi:MAG TPA: NADH-quinone oxidoreductase subunit NuoH [Anaerolineaceae bacterium]|jgi:NADH-quinone oxidoreductase subunit H
MNITFWSDPVHFIGNWLQGLLLGWGLMAGLVQFLLSLLGVIVLAMGGMMFVIFLIWYERKIIGRLQDRYGPNRVGPWGIFQPIADMVKIFTKEYITPRGADVVPYNLAPVLAVAAVLMIWAVVPFAQHTFGVDLNVGVLYIVGVGGIGTLGIIFAGWSSNNKYALLGAFRVVAQLISYEVPMVLALLVPVMFSGSMGLNAIVEAQANGNWFLFVSPVAALVFFISSVAEVNRAPFDLVEAESEIVAGFNIEYSGLKFGMFYVAEFLHAFTVSLIFVALFLGGWQGPGAANFPLLGFVYFGIKTMAVHFLGIWMRGSLPRFRIDQMMNLNWKVLTPVSLALVMATALLAKAFENSSSFSKWLVQFIANLVIGWVSLELLRYAGRHERDIELMPIAGRPAPEIPLSEPEAPAAPSGAHS